MNKYVFSTLGKSGIPVAIIEAENVDKALELFGGVDDKIDPHKRFSTHYFTGLYEVKLQDAANPIYIIHSTK